MEEAFRWIASVLLTASSVPAVQERNTENMMRRNELRQEMAEAEAAGDIGKVEQLRNEFEELRRDLKYYITVESAWARRLLKDQRFAREIVDLMKEFEVASPDDLPPQVQVKLVDDMTQLLLAMLTYGPPG